MVVRWPLVATAFFSLVYASSFQTDVQSAGIEAVFPEDEDYSAYINPFNPRYIYKPAAFTLPANAEQVAQVVQLAVKNDLHVTARSGGHSYISNSLGWKDGEVVVDLRQLNEVTVDPSTYQAKVGSGNRLGGLALALNKAGRATPHGICPDVGIGGHASYGGSGYVNRQWGLTLDAIESMDVVLGNGTLLHASVDENPDLFWAMRGAGGSYGITTAYYMKTYPVPPSVTYFTYYYSNLTSAEATKALSTFQSYILSGPPPTLGANFLVGSNGTPGSVYAILVGALYDDPSRYNSIIQPMLEAFPQVQQDGKNAKVIVDSGSYIHSLELMGRFIGSPSLSNTTVRTYSTFTKSLMTPEKEPMSQEALKAFVDFFAYEGAEQKLPFSCIVESYGGPNSYLNSVPLNATAFAHRDSLFTLECILSDVNNTLKDSPETGYYYVNGVIDSIVKNMPYDWNYGAYPNYIDDSLEDWQERYYGGHYPALQQIKQKYDPQNMFNFPLGIELPSEDTTSLGTVIWGLGLFALFTPLVYYIHHSSTSLCSV